MIRDRIQRVDARSLGGLQLFGDLQEIGVFFHVGRLLGAKRLEFLNDLCQVGFHLLVRQRRRPTILAGQIAAVPLPKCDPVYGMHGPLIDRWCGAERS